MSGSKTSQVQTDPIQTLTPVESELPSAVRAANLKVGNSMLKCAVLDDDKNTRILSRTTFVQALGRTGGVKGGRRFDRDYQLPAFLTAKNLEPFLPSDLDEYARPILFKSKGTHPTIGYRAEFLPVVCEVFMEAHDAGALKENQIHIAEQCRILYRSFARIGIVALIDEATGHQEHRAKDALAQLLRLYISEELSKWAKTFPDDYYKQLFRLRNLTYNEFTTKRPRIIGRLTNQIVYDRLGPNVKDALEGKNPKDELGRRKDKHFQWLTPEVGQVRLKEHLAALVSLMRLSKNWNDFKRNLARGLPKWDETVQLDLVDVDENFLG